MKIKASDLAKLAAGIGAGYFTQDAVRRAIDSDDDSTIERMLKNCAGLAVGAGAGYAVTKLMDGLGVSDVIDDVADEIGVSDAIDSVTDVVSDAFSIFD